MRIERSKYATEALLSFSSKVRRRATDIEHSANYHQLLDNDSSALKKRPNSVRRKTSVSFADTEQAVHHGHYTSTDEDSCDDDHKRLLGSYDKQLEDRCQVLDILSSEDGKPYTHSATKKRLLSPGSVDVGGSPSRQGPMTFHELGFKPLQKTVHFSTVEVKIYQRGRRYDKHVYYSKDELSDISKQRHKDAAKLQKERLFSGHHKEDLTPTLLSIIFDPNDDIYKRASSRGIEHIVYPELRREIMRKQKKARAEVLNYVRSNPFDPDGTKLREHSEQYTKWARELAAEKAKCYAQNNDLFLSKKKNVLQASVLGNSVGRSVVKEDATILDFKKVKISIDDVDAALGKGSIHKNFDSSENTVPLTKTSHPSDYEI